MRFLLDQSADFRLIPHLLRLGHDVQAISREYPAGLPDDEVLAVAHREHRILITADRDFGELVVRQHRPHAGVMLMRLPGASLQSKIARLTYVLARYADQLTQVIVVTDRRVRVRPARETPG